MNMMTTPQQASMSALLSSVATIVSVNTTGLGMTRKDKNAGALAERDHAAKSGIASVNVNRLPRATELIKSIRQQVTQAREAVVANTTAWGDRRLLANTMMERMLRTWQPIKLEHDRLVNELKEKAPAWIEEARTRDLGTFDVEPPSIDEINDAFSLEFKMEAVPDVSRFQASHLDKAVEAELRRRFEADITSAYQQAQQDAIHRLAEPLKNLVERMDAFQKREDEKARGLTVGKEGYFRDSVIDNVNKIAEVFGSFNLTGDPALAALAQQLDVFKGVDAEALRKHEDQRKATKKQAEAILEQLGDWIR